MVRNSSNSASIRPSMALKAWPIESKASAGGPGGTSTRACSWPAVTSRTTSARPRARSAMMPVIMRLVSRLSSRASGITSASVASSVFCNSISASRLRATSRR